MAVQSLQNRSRFTMLLFFYLLQCFFIVCVSSTSRVAIIFRGKHTTYHHFIEEQKRLLIEPFNQNGIIVDIYLISQNSSKWHEMETQYKALTPRNGVFESSMMKTDLHGLDAQHGEEIYESLNMAAKTCGQRTQTDSEDKKFDTNSCWDAIIVCHFAIAPKVSILSFGFEHNKLMLPWMEAHSPLPDNELTITNKQIRKSCAAFTGKYKLDMYGQRSAHVVFWFDGKLFDKLSSIFKPLSDKENDERVSDAHYMFQTLIEHDMVKYAMRGYWESNAKNPNPVN